MCDGIPPVPGWCVGDDLTDDISDDWPPARDLPRVLIQADQGGQIGPYIDHRPVVSPPGKWSTGAAEEGGGNIAFGEEVKGDVGSDLVDTSSVALSFRLSGVPVDPAHGCVGPVGGQVEPVHPGHEDMVHEVPLMVIVEPDRPHEPSKIIGQPPQPATDDDAPSTT